MNLKTLRTWVEIAFTGMPSSFYSGLCSDSPGQQGQLTLLCSAQGENRTHRRAGIHLSPWANSISLALDTEMPKREASHCPDSSYPALRHACWPEQLSLDAAPVLRLSGQRSPRRRQMAPRLCMCFYSQTLKLPWVGLQLPDTAKCRGRRHVESLDERTGLSKSFPPLQSQPCCVVRGSRVCFTILLVGLNEITCTWQELVYILSSTPRWADKRRRCPRSQFWHYLPEPSGLPGSCPSPYHSKEGAGLGPGDPPWNLLHSYLPNFTTTSLFILLKRTQGIWTFSTRICTSNLRHPCKTSCQMVT